MSPASTKVRKNAAAETTYPDHDEQSLIENDPERDLMMDSIAMLEEYFEAQSDVYVSGGIMLYYKEGDPTKCLMPDVLVSRGIPKRKRRSYQRWVEGKMPDVVIEIASESTFAFDMGIKSSMYYTLGVQEYYVFDWSGRKLEDRPLYGMVRDEAGFSLLPPDENGRLQSAILGLDLYAEPGEESEPWRLRFYDPDTGRVLKTYKELVTEERGRREEAERRASQAEDEIKKLREELHRLQTPAGAKR